MAKIIPFRAIRPPQDKVHLVATRSYVTYPLRQLKRRLAENPYSFIHVINPEYSSNRKPVKGVARFPLVREKYLEFVENGILAREEEPALYLYKQIQPNDSFLGIIGGISIDDYQNGTIKVHEQTLTRREKLFKQYLDVCNFNAEPVLLTYPDDSAVESVMQSAMEERPFYDFTTTDRIRHQLWTITDELSIAKIAEQFSHMNSLYIADGHHRTASSSLLGNDRRKANKNHGGEEMYNYLMACLIPESRLSIYDYNRVVKDLNGLDTNTFLNLLSVDFEVQPLDEIRAPEGLHEFSMYLSGKWFLLRLRNPPQSKSPVAHLDSQILSEKILLPHLNIRDLKTDSRIEFVSGKVGMDGLKLYTDKKKMAVAFGLFPVSTEQLKEVADAGETMPPKTTWIEPKLRSGLTVFGFDD